MNNDVVTEIKKLNENISALIDRLDAPQIPFNVKLWRIEDIAQYLQRSTGSVHKYVINRPDFPKAIRVQSGGWPLYEAKEVIAWVKRRKDKN